MKEIILFQGDSITDCGRSRENDGSMGSGYATMVAAELGADVPYRYQFYNRGVSGDRIVDLYARIRIDMINLKPDCMSIELPDSGDNYTTDTRKGVAVEYVTKSA